MNSTRHTLASRISSRKPSLMHSHVFQSRPVATSRRYPQIVAASRNQSQANRNQSQSLWILDHHRIPSSPFLVWAEGQGAAYGGGVGLVSCCDIALGISKATFTLSEVKLGILPATISPYVIARIGTAQARR